MKKNIPIIIKKTHAHLGNKGEIKVVSLGYASNYLIPNNIAEPANRVKIKQIAIFKQNENKKQIENQTIASRTKTYLDNIIKISIKKKSSQNQQIFGKISEKDIIEKIYMITGEKLQKRQVIIPEIKNTGIYNIKVKLAENLETLIKLQILPDCC
uniref:50S ribosomal protein L9, chloroplastic n=1 Tax=Sporolithon durum TaxID=48970 RepID=A0A141SD55_9FLOR|nr:ribosomal protein L9 [Sporolithon durum]AMK96223.1 ribosomal protein L9 [Sporolithon durum]